jgi:hypothetical protein
MLVALTSDGARVEAAAARRGEAYTCPACRAPVVLKQGRRVLAHFAHARAQPCWIVSEPESPMHLAMKAVVYARFKGERWVRGCALERVIGQRRADVWLETVVGPVAVECQVSPVPVTELAAKLRAYTEAGIATLYLVHHSVLASLTEGAEVRVPAWVLALHALYRGRVYVYRADGAIVPVHLGAVFRQNEWDSGPAVRRLKTTRQVAVGEPLVSLELRCVLIDCQYGALAGGSYLVAMGREGVFWVSAW